MNQDQSLFDYYTVLFFLLTSKVLQLDWSVNFVRALIVANSLFTSLITYSTVMNKSLRPPPKNANFQ